MLKCYGPKNQQDDEIANLASHWIRAGSKFVLLGEPNDVADAEACFAAASGMLRGAGDKERLEIVEAFCKVQGWVCQLHWMKGEARSAICALEEAHAVLSRSGPMFLHGSRRFLAEQVALSIASVAGVDPAGGEAADPRDLLKLVDLALGLLGDGDEHVALRDRALRLRSWFCLREDELEAAGQALQLHSATDDQTCRLLKLTLMLKSSQKAAACKEAVEWLRDGSKPLPFVTGREAVRLLAEQGCARAALDAVGAIVDRFSSDASEYSELIEIKHELVLSLADGDADANRQAAQAHLRRAETRRSIKARRPARHARGAGGAALEEWLAPRRHAPLGHGRSWRHSAHVRQVRRPRVARGAAHGAVVRARHRVLRRPRRGGVRRAVAGRERTDRVATAHVQLPAHRLRRHRAGARGVRVHGRRVHVATGSGTRGLPCAMR